MALRRSARIRKRNGKKNAIATQKLKAEEKMAKMKEELRTAKKEAKELQKKYDNLKMNFRRCENLCIRLCRYYDGTTKCNLCRQQFQRRYPERRPRILPCGHTLCSQCLIQISGIQQDIFCPFDGIVFFGMTRQNVPINFQLSM